MSSYICSTLSGCLSWETPQQSQRVSSSVRHYFLSYLLSEVPPDTYFIISKQPESRGLVVFIVCDVQVICSSLKDVVFIPRVCFGFCFHHFAGVQGRLQTRTLSRISRTDDHRHNITGHMTCCRTSPHLFPTGRFPRILKRQQEGHHELHCSLCQVASLLPGCE